MKRLNIKKLNELEGEEPTTRENTKISATYSLGYNELKKHTPWFEEDCSELLN
jgi:hypothetical protein